MERRARAKGKAWGAIRPVDFRVRRWFPRRRGRSGGFRSCRHCLRFGRPFVPHGWFRRRGRKSRGSRSRRWSFGNHLRRELDHRKRGQRFDGRRFRFGQPESGAYFSGGAGAGGSIRLVARSIVNKGNLSAKGGHASGIDPREPGVRFLSNSGGAGGGGRVAFLYDDTLEQGSVVVDGGTSNGDAKAGEAEPFSSGLLLPAPLVDLNLTTGTVVFDTAGAWTHSSGIKGKGTVTRSIFSTNGRSFGYGVCRFRFNHFSLGPGVSVVVRGSNSLFFSMSKAMPRFPLIFPWMEKVVCKVFIPVCPGQADGLRAVGSETPKTMVTFTRR